MTSIFDTPDFNERLFFAQPDVSLGRGLLVFAIVAGCGSSVPTPPQASGSQWPAADALFHHDASWLGADAAYSIDLGGERTLWLFGDTFVATTPENVRAHSTMVRNTIAVQTGRDPTSASIAFAWRTSTNGAPASYFAEEADRWHWPGHGVRLGPSGPLIIFLSVLRPTPGQGLGFGSAGWRVAIVDDPSGDPAAWSPRLVDPVATPFDAVVGGAVVREGGFVIALATRFEGTHAGYLARVRETDLVAGKLVPEWWAGTRGWVAQVDLGGLPTVVLDDAGAECSIHHDALLDRWVHIASRGFGATTIAVRVATALTGPWSAPVDAYTPPESLGAQPFVYAAKAHPEISTGSTDLAVTYATNSFDFATLVQSQATLYWPRFVRVALRPAAKR